MNIRQSRMVLPVTGASLDRPFMSARLLSIYEITFLTFVWFSVLYTFQYSSMYDACVANFLAAEMLCGVRAILTPPRVACHR